MSTQTGWSTTGGAGTVLTSRAKRVLKVCYLSDFCVKGLVREVFASQARGHESGHSEPSKRKLGVVLHT